MNNEELRDLRNKLLLSIVVVLVIVVPFIVLFVNRYMGIKSSVYKAYKADETFAFLVYDSSNCSKCEMIRSNLKDFDTKVLEYDVRKANDKDVIFTNIGLAQNKVKMPALVYVKDGVTTLITLDIKDSEAVSDFIEYSKLG